ncbi:FMN-binding protein [Pseudofrankia sp. DC12]|uniref:FMN-binding protein n=1 Tax=Pseudofrankia sp. DC12 TaxID=683315 RepID=UPI001E632568|nr:FMN-binding protein [Pseudofrankia sp. DC12]
MPGATTQAGQPASSDSPSPAAATTSPASASAASATPTAGSAAAATAGASSGTGSSGSTGTGTTGTRTVVGDVEDTRYGAVQVELVLSGRTITDVIALQVPNRERRDIEINDQAVPILRQEVLAAQSAKIDAVSGASFTSSGYAWSVQSAIDKAGL